MTQARIALGMIRSVRTAKPKRVKVTKRTVREAAKHDHRNLAR